MRTALLLLAGFFAALVSLSGFGGWTLAATFLVYGTVTYPLHFPPRDGRPWAALVGVAAGMELLGTSRFGTAALYSLIIYGTVILLADLARFTSPLGRFIVALTIMAIAYPLVLLPPAHFFGAVTQLAFAWAVVAGASSLIHRTRKLSEYELA